MWPKHVAFINSLCVFIIRVCYALFQRHGWFVHCLVHNSGDAVASDHTFCLCIFSSSCCGWGKWNHRRHSHPQQYPRAWVLCYRHTYANHQVSTHAHIFKHIQNWKVAHLHLSLSFKVAEGWRGGEARRRGADHVKWPSIGHLACSGVWYSTFSLCSN